MANTYEQSLVHIVSSTQDRSSTIPTECRLTRNMFPTEKQTLCRAYGALESFLFHSHGYAADAAPPWANLSSRRWRSVHGRCALCLRLNFVWRFFHFHVAFRCVPGELTVIPKGPENESMPSLSSKLAPITLPDADGQQVKLGSLWASRPAVVVFLRHWG